MTNEYTEEDKRIVESLRLNTDDQLTEWFIAFRTWLEQEAEIEAAYIAPQVKKMTMVQNELHRRLIERNPGFKPGMKASGSTAHGTFFLKTNSSVKVADREAFHSYVFQHQAKNFLTAHVAKDAVEEYQKEHDGALPPGITIDYITQLQVRKT